MAADNPGAHQADLAMALYSLGVWLDMVGRAQEALAATEESVTLRRALAADDPAAHQADLARRTSSSEAICGWPSSLMIATSRHEFPQAAARVSHLRGSLLRPEPLCYARGGTGVSLWDERGGMARELAQAQPGTQPAVRRGKAVCGSLSRHTSRPSHQATAP